MSKLKKTFKRFKPKSLKIHMEFGFPILIKIWIEAEF